MNRVPFIKNSTNDREENRSNNGKYGAAKTASQMQKVWADGKNWMNNVLATLMCFKFLSHHLFSLPSTAKILCRWPRHYGATTTKRCCMTKNDWPRMLFSYFPSFYILVPLVLIKRSRAIVIASLSALRAPPIPLWFYHVAHFIHPGPLGRRSSNISSTQI